MEASRSCQSVEAMQQFNPLRNGLRKNDFNSFVQVLKDSLQAYLAQTAEKEISLLGLNSIVESSLNKAEAHKAIRSRIKAKIEEQHSHRVELCLLYTSDAADE